MPSRVIAVGDVHGCCLALEALLDAIGPTGDDILVTLGDYIDRGPDSCGVIEQLLRLETCTQLVPLLGNHELMMLASFSLPGQLPFWLRYGGRETLASYGGSIDSIPASHLAFFSRCRPFYETETHFFVHANYAPELPLDEQPEELLYWEHLCTNPPPHHSGKRAVVGHSAQTRGEIFDVGHLVCIDTHCCGDGWLTALDVENGTLWQADKQGKMRSG